MCDNLSLETIVPPRTLRDILGRLLHTHLATLVPKPGTRKPARRHATRPADAACGACQVARRSSSSSTSSAPGHEAGARGSLPAPGPGAG